MFEPMKINYRTASVYGIYGSLGGGKSITAVDIMIDFLSRGHEVYSNIRLYNLPSSFVPLFHYYDAEGFDFKTLPYGSPRGTEGKKRVCIVIDEAAEYLDQFSSTSAYTRNFCSWLRHTSKNGQFVFLLVQSPDFLVKSVRLIVANWICCVYLASFVLPLSCFVVLLIHPFPISPSLYGSRLIRAATWSRLACPIRWWRCGF